MITVSGITKQYGKRIAVDDITFDVAAGRTVPGSRPPCE
jgi:ABC-2 type transport system ATP-binding protein